MADELRLSSPLYARQSNERAADALGAKFSHGVGGGVAHGQQSPVTPPDFSCTTKATPTCAPFGISNSARQSNALLYGYSVGLGLDWAVTPNLFLRGEFEFVQFVPLNSLSVNVTSARVGAGLKF